MYGTITDFIGKQVSYLDIYQTVKGHFMKHSFVLLVILSFLFSNKVISCEAHATGAYNTQSARPDQSTNADSLHISWRQHKRMSLHNLDEIDDRTRIFQQISDLLNHELTHHHHDQKKREANSFASCFNTSNF